MEPFEHLLNQIDAFIRKYYKNEMLKGGILFLGVLLLSYLIVASLEYFGRFATSVRAFLFFSFLASNVFLLVKYLIVPSLKLISFGKRIDRYQAAKIIGSFFPQVSDRLLNTLQLNDNLTNQDVNYELIRASVVQKAQNLSVVPFINGIELRKNLKYAKFVLPIVVVFILISLVFPKLISQGTDRIVHYNQEFKIEAPFSFVLTTPSAGIEEGQDVPVAVKLAIVEFEHKVCEALPVGAGVVQIISQ